MPKALSDYEEWSPSYMYLEMLRTAKFAFEDIVASKDEGHFDRGVCYDYGNL